MKPEEYEGCSLRSGVTASMTREQCRQAHICWWCGIPLTGRQVYWCGSGYHRPCEQLWRSLHDWTTARPAAMTRAERKCQRCGAEASEVNHREPLVGRGYHSGCVHHPENLEPLCHGCHTAETTRQLYDRKMAATAEGRDYLGRRARRRLGLPQIPPTPTPGFRRESGLLDAL